jgi:hypothetical protein
MSLSYDLTKIENHKEVCNFVCEEKAEDGSPLYQMRVKTQHLIFATMSVGINCITEKNYKQFYARFLAAQAVLEIDHNIKLDDIKAHIGLTTNASKRTDKEFMEMLYFNIR